jgi:ribonuclease D
MSLPPATFITNDAQLLELAHQLQTESLIAVDTESNNLYAYVGRICLIQLSTRTQDYIIDPLKINHMQPLIDVLANPAIEKIFHAAEYDLICLRRDFNAEVYNLFDTMFAARLCGIEQFGLGDLLRQFFDVEVDKSHQLDNWGKRPLPQESLRYAQMDTHYLPALRDLFVEKLTALNRIEESVEVFADVLRIEVKEREFDEDGYWKLGRPQSLTRRQMAVLKELYLLREEIAREEDLPPFKVLSNNTLTTLARVQPHNINELFALRGLNNRQVRTYGNRLLTALDRGRSSRLPAPPEPDSPDPVLAERYIALHAWRKERAAARGLDSSLVLSKHTLWEIARRLPADFDSLRAIEGMGQWRARAYGDEILRLVSTLR